MQLNFSFGHIDQLWLPGKLPFERSYDHRVKVALAGTSNSYFPAFLQCGDLLCSQRPSPLQHAVTLLLAYPYSTVPLNLPPPKEGEWSDVPGSTIYRQIRIALSSEAISQIRAVEADTHAFDLALSDVRLHDVTPRK